jgi:hypothetical protein
MRLNRELAHIGAAPQHRRHQQQPGEIIALRRHQRRQRGANAHAGQHHTARPGRLKQEIRRSMHAVDPELPMLDSDITIQIEVAGVAGAGIVEPHSRIAGVGAFVSHHPQRMMRIQTVTHQARADQHRDVTGHLLRRLMQPAKATVE